MAEMRTPATRRALRLAAPLVAGALVFGACSKSNDTAQTTANTTGGQTAATSGGNGDGSGSGSGSKSTATTAPGVASLDTAVWSGGFRYDLGKAGFDKETQTLTIETVVNNLGKDASTPYPTAALQADGVQLVTGNLKQSQQIIGGQKSNDTFTFNLSGEDNFDVAKTEFVLGSSGKQQAKVPLSGKGDKTTLAPVEQKDTPLKDPATIGEMTVTAKKVELRYDDPYEHTEADEGKAFLFIEGTQKNNSSDQTLYWDTNKVSITAPDGQSSTADQLVESLLSPTKSDDTFYIKLTLDTPVDGDYQFTWGAQPFGADAAEVTLPPLTLTLTSKGAEGGSGSTGTTVKGSTGTTR